MNYRHISTNIQLIQNLTKFYKNMENKFENIDLGWNNWLDDLVIIPYVEDNSEEAEKLLDMFIEFDDWYNSVVKLEIEAKK